MEIRVLFFGVLTTVTGMSFRIYQDIKSFDHLKQAIGDDFPEINNYSYLIAVNNEIINSDPELNDGDEVALMPPFAGG
jgi:sulfur-carrier protein